jgi:biotin-dependent carboxylase-like uncharacterized protein
VSLIVVESGPLATVQDLGRRGWAHVGVPRAGALDQPAARLANRLVGNTEDRAVVEVTMGGLVWEAGRGHWFAVCGAEVSVTVDGRAVAHGRAEWAPEGSTVRLGTPSSGVRSYVAVTGGIDVEPVLGSRATDTLAWVGPDPLRPGTVMPLGAPHGEPRAHDTPRPPAAGALRVRPGPRADWFSGDALQRLVSAAWTVRGESDRVGLRLSGPALERVRDDELPSEPMVLGAVQVPADAQPVIFLHDHPVTGGYPVLAVVAEEDLWMCAQARPGEILRLRPAPPA